MAVLSRYTRNGNAPNYGDVVELVDTLALGASAARREGSSPFIPTKSGYLPGGKFSAGQAEMSEVLISEDKSYLPVEHKVNRCS